MTRIVAFSPELDTSSLRARRIVNTVIVIALIILLIIAFLVIERRISNREHGGVINELIQ